MRLIHQLIAAIVLLGAAPAFAEQPALKQFAPMASGDVLGNVSGSPAAPSALALSSLLPSATASQLYGGTGAPGAAQAVTVGTSLSLSGESLGLNLGNANTWTAAQTFSGGLSGALTGHASLDLPLTGSTMTGELVISASAAANAGFNLPQGYAPTSPVNGDLWATSAGLYVRISGSTLGPLGSGVSTFSAGPTGLSPNSPTPGAITLGGTLATGYGGTGQTTFTSNLPLIGAGTGAIAQGSRSGNTTDFATVGGTLVSGDCVSIDANLNLVDAGEACTTGGGGGTVNSAAAGQLAYYGSTGTAVSGDANVRISAGALSLGIASSVQGSLILANISAAGLTTLATANTSANPYTLTLPAITDTLVTLTATQTLTNKSIAGSEINSGAVLAAYLPTATTNALGIMEVSTGLSVNSGVVTVTNPSPGSSVAGDLVTFSNSSGALQDSGALLSSLAPKASPALTNVVITGALTATGLVTNADLVNPSLTIGATSVTLGTTVTTFAGLVSVTSTTFVGSLTGGASLDLALTGGTMSGDIAMGGYNVTGAGSFTATSTADYEPQVILTNTANDLTSPNWATHKSRNGNAVNNGDYLAQLSFYSNYSSGSESVSAFIAVIANGSPGASHTPGAFEFHTIDSSGTDHTALRLYSTGAAQFGSLSTAGIVTSTAAGLLGTAAVVPFGNGGLPCYMLEAYGGAADGTTDNLAAWNSAITAIGSTNGCIQLGSGTYKFSAVATDTMPNGAYSLSVLGNGSGVTTLTWPNTAGGITVNMPNVNNAVHFSRLSLTTSQSNSSSGKAVYLNQTATGGPGTAVSDFSDILIHGADGFGQTDYWQDGIYISYHSNVNFDNVNIIGGSTVGGYGNVGVGIYLVGASGTPPVQFNIVNSGINLYAEGIYYGAYVQGVAISNTNFTGDNYCIAANSGQTGDQLSVTNSQLNCGTIGIWEVNEIDATLIANNLFLLPANVIGIDLVKYSRFTITGNDFESLTGATPSGQNGVVVSTNAGNGHGVIVGNLCDYLVTCIYESGAATTNVVIGDNSYLNNANNVVNSSVASGTPGASPSIVACVIPDSAAINTNWCVWEATIQGNVPFFDSLTSQYQATCSTTYPVVEIYDISQTTAAGSTTVAASGTPTVTTINASVASAVVNDEYAFRVTTAGSGCSTTLATEFITLTATVWQ